MQQQMTKQEIKREKGKELGRERRASMGGRQRQAKE